MVSKKGSHPFPYLIPSGCCLPHEIQIVKVEGEIRGGGDRLHADALDPTLGIERERYIGIALTELLRM